MNPEFPNPLLSWSRGRYWGIWLFCL